MEEGTKRIYLKIESGVIVDLDVENEDVRNISCVSPKIYTSLDGIHYELDDSEELKKLLDGYLQTFDINEELNKFED